ncbi:helix-turn-helix domain-containing protein [Vagococcus zengguangii]|nr:helix-turn-helix domain-containing protein [Vagococcus zengguangii]
MNNQNFCTINYQKISKNYRIFSEQLTLLLVLEGTITIEDEGELSHLTKGQLYCLNLNHLVIIQADSLSNSSVVFLQINPMFFNAQLPDFLTVKFIIPITDANYDQQQAITKLTNLFVDLLINEFSFQETRAIKQLILLESIILALTEHFKIESHFISLHSDNFQTKEIIQFINQHYQKGLTVKQIAEEFFLSEATLSKTFKKETGSYLSKYLKKLQITRSINELLYSDLTIEQIALNVGFNSAKIYREQFKLLFHMSPTEYREQHIHKKKTDNVITKSINNKPKELISVLYQLAHKENQVRQPEELHQLTKHLNISTIKPIRSKKTNEIIVHLEYLSDLNKAHIQAELLELLDQQTLTTISCFDFFPELPISYRLAKNAHLNSFPAFEELDTALSFLTKHQIKLMVQFNLSNFNEQTLMLYSEIFNYIINRWGKTFLTHISINVQSVTLANIETYQQFYQQIRYAFPDIRFGVKLPISDPYDNELAKININNFLKQLAGNFQFLSYSADSNYIFKQSTDIRDGIVEAHHYLTNKTNWVKYRLSENDISCPLYLTEWNTLTGTTINYNGMFFRGALITKQLLVLEKLVEGYGFWLNLESHEHHNLQASINSIGLDLFHYHQNKRPAFFSLQLSNRLNGVVVKEDDFYIMTKKGQQFQVMIWNENYFDPHLSTELSFINSHILTLSLAIQDIFKGKYQVKQIDFNRESGALFYSYMDFKKTAHLDKETIDYIYAKNRPNLKVFDIEIDKSFNYSFSLDSNAVILLEFTPIAT